MKKLSYFMLLLLSTLFVASCKEDEKNELSKLTVVVTSKLENVDYSALQVQLTELRTMQVYKCNPDPQGTALIGIPFGQYSIVVSDDNEGVSTLYGSTDNFTFSLQNNLVTIEVKDIQSALDRTFVFGELFFNCSTNGDWDNNYYEEYFTLRNVSDKPLYADGLSFAICGDYNCVEDDGIKSSYLNRDSIVVSQIYTLPGDGRTYLVQPGESLVIAHSAIDHTQGGAKPAARNLSGADFEIYVPYEYSMTTDNPEVTNVTVNYSMFQAFSWGYGGYAPILLLRADTDLNDYVQSHLTRLKVTGAWGDQMQDYLVLPQSWIIDGVEAASADNMLHKVLPNHIDRSYITIEDSGIYGGFHSQFVQRKSAAEGYVLDSNDSANDCEVIVGGQKNYIK